MKKIIVLFNGINAPWHITTFALNIAAQNHAEVHAIFLKDESANYPFPSDINSVQAEAGSGEKEEQSNVEMIEKNIKLFKAFCDDEKIKCFFERDIALKQLVDSSADADCIVADSHIDITGNPLQQIVKEIKCPVCLISVNATKIKNLILLYDGSDGAAEAIKTYRRLFPKLSKKKSYLLVIDEKEKIKKKEREDFLKKTEKKFGDVEVISFNKKVEKKLIEFLDDHTENAIVVMSAYGKKSIARLFEPSLLNTVLEKSRTSLFIAHD